MDGTNEGITSATDHTHSEFSVFHGSLFKIGAMKLIVFLEKTMFL